MRRISLLLLSIMLFFWSIPAFGESAGIVILDGIRYEIRNGEAAIVGFADGAESITPHTFVNGYPAYYMPDENGLPGEEAIREIVFEEGITGIDISTARYMNLMYFMTSVERIVLPSSVSLINFDGFQRLKEYQVADGSPFYKAVDSVLYSADGKTLVKFPAGKSGSCTLPGGVTSVGENAFPWDSKLERLILPEGVKELGNNALAGAARLKELFLPASLDKIGEEALPRNGVLEKITVAEGNKKYRSMDGVLFSGDGKTLLLYPSGRRGHYDVPVGTTDMDKDAFGYSCQLSSLNIPEGITELDAYLLNGMQLLESLHLPASLSSIGEQALPGNGALQQITVADENTHFQSQDGILFSHNGETLVNYPVGRDGPFEIPQGTSVISPSAFGFNDGLTSVTVPEGVADIAEYLFSGLGALEEVYLPSTISEIGDGAFPSYGAIRRVEVAQGGQCYQSIDGVLFEGDELIFYPRCHGLSYDVPLGTKRIREQAFAECEMLQTVTVPRGVTQIGEETFYHCTSLERISLPVTLREIGPLAFADCISLTGIMLAPGLETIDNFAFNNCSSLAFVHLPDSLTMLGRGAFSDCVSLSGVVLPNGLEIMGENAFSNCASLVEMMIPSAVKEIGSDAFHGCKDGFVLYSGKDSPAYWHAFEYGLLFAEPGGVPAVIDPVGRTTQSAVVNTVKSQDVVSLLTKPQKGAKTVGKYRNGTTVQVLDTSGDWAHVQLYGAEGYMPIKSLMFTDKLNKLVRISWGRKNFEMSSSLQLYSDTSEEAPSTPITEDVPMRILDTVGVWYHVLSAGQEGYVPVHMMKVAFSQTPDNPNVSYYVVVNPNPQDRLNLRSEPSANSQSLGRYFNGTQVEVLWDCEVEGWVHVRVDGQEGYMMSQFLQSIDWGKDLLWHG